MPTKTKRISGIRKVNPSSLCDLFKDKKIKEGQILEVRGFIGQCGSSYEIVEAFNRKRMHTLAISRNIYGDGLFLFNYSFSFDGRDLKSVSRELILDTLKGYRNGLYLDRLQKLEEAIANLQER